MEGYLVDALPSYNSVVLVLDGFRKVKVRTTFPIYVITDRPEMIAQHPSVVNYNEEVWRDLDGRQIRLYRFELTDINAYYYIKKRVKTVNELPTVMSQVLHRLNALPFRKITVEESGKEKRSSAERVGNSSARIELHPEEFPKVSFATVTSIDWYGPSPYGKRYVANINGEEEQEGKIDDLDLKVDVAECFGIACDKVKASVKIRSKKAPVSIKGLIEWSLLSKTLIRELENSTIGKALTTNEAWIAFQRKVIIPNVVPRVEKMRTLDELKAVDKGGLVIFPRVGCYNNVYQVDFSSMYPSLIVKYNISAETVDKCNDVETEIGHMICLKEKGIVPEALEWLVNRKEELKKVDKERAEAIKWILVASFGYLGYRNSKFGKIEAYELVTYFARKTLRRTIDLAGEHGLEVLHGIIDSLIVRGDRIREFIDHTQQVTGLKLKEEKMKWVILFNAKDGTPYPMRYLGKLENGEMKVKGLIRKNMPNIVKEFLEDVVEVTGKADTCEQIDVGEIDVIYRRYRQRVAHAEPKDYVLWVKRKPYVRGVRGFYDARKGYKGRDVFYYLDYLERSYEVILSALNGILDLR
ncbi:DNA polymerase II [Sulfolobus acidocaldarius SUSAZ]|nr:DNA polymerase II [Sulfolobus acidocaldarius SUSAZ]